MTPLQLATYASRIATGRNVQPHLIRSVAGRLAGLTDLGHATGMDMPENFFEDIRAGISPW
ncbi:hypothetical protein RAA17_06670 [Komagataeibacter rhaeticus]|nr:hypothetical protein [Komagataeibacter rhaeticus]